MQLRLKSFIRIFLQLAACFLLFYAVTGGALLHSSSHHRFLTENLGFFELLRLSAVFGLGLLWTAAVFFKLGPDSLEPLRSVRYIAQNFPGRFTAFLTVLFFAGHFSALYFMHKGMGTALWDFGYYDDVVWNSAKGHPLITSARGGIYILGDHFKPVLFLLSPAYWFQSSSAPILFIFSAGAAASIPLVYLLGKEITGSKQTALLFASCVFFYQPLRNAVDFPYHTVIFADPLLLLAFYCFLKDKTVCGLAACALALGCKENIVMEVLGLGIYFILARKKSGWMTAALALCVFFFTHAILGPQVRWEHNPINKWDFYEHFRNWEPRLWMRLLEPNPLVFLFLMFAPFLFLTLFAKNVFWFLSPTFAMRFLNSMRGFREIKAHYPSGLTSLTFITAMLGFKRVSEFQNGKFKQFLLPGLFFASLIFMGTPSLFKIEGHLWEASSGKNQSYTKILETIPENYSVKAPEAFFAHVTHRYLKFGYGTVLPGTPLEEKSQDIDLFIVDEKRSGKDEAKVEEIYRLKNYALAFDAGEMKIYSRPGFQVPETVTAEWRKTLNTPAVPYKKIAAKTYTALFVTALLLLTALLIKREFLVSLKL